MGFSENKFRPSGAENFKFSDQEGSGPLEMMRKFHRSITGRSLELLAALIVGRTAVDYTMGKMTRAAAWKEFQSHHPEQVQIEYPTMDEVPQELREQILETRDNQYVERVSDGLKEYATKANNASAAEAKKNQAREEALRSAMEAFRPSAYDRLLTESGMGHMVRTDIPFPVVSFVDPNDRKPEVISPGLIASPDTIFIDSDSPEIATEATEHAYLHTTQIDYGSLYKNHHVTMDNQKTKKVAESETNFQPFSEGANELLRLKLNTLLDRKTEYKFGEIGVRNVDKVIEAIGPEHFWGNYMYGHYAAIEKDYNARYGAGAFERLFQK